MNMFKQIDAIDTSELNSSSNNQKKDIEIINQYNEFNTNYPKLLMDAHNVEFNVLNKVLTYEVHEYFVDFIIESKGYTNSHFWTHETMLNCLYEQDENNKKTSHLRICFYNDRVFRVHYNDGEKYNDVIDLSKLHTQMLIGKPSEDTKLDIKEDNNIIIIKTNSISLQVDKTPFKITAFNKDNQIVYEQKGYETWISDSVQTSYASIDDRKVFYESLVLHPQEKIFGLGERFDHVERTGKSVDFWNKDVIGTSSKRSYKNIPFYWSTNGYGLFLNTYGCQSWEIGTRDGGVLSFGTDDEYMDYFVICENQPKDIMRQYYNLTGEPDMPPIWSFGLWMSRNSYLTWDVVEEVVDDMTANQIPFDVIHLDTAWFEEDWNCDLKFSKKRFPDPEKNIKSLKQRGIYTSLWQYNFIPNKPNNDNLKIACEKGYLATNDDGTVYQYPDYVKGSWIDDAIIDFSNDEVVRWYCEQISDLIEMGVGAIKTDFGEGIPARATYKNIDGRYFHNYYSLVYNSAIHEAIKSVDAQTLLWSRSATAGGHRYPVHWGGDSQCTWGGLAGTLKGLISASMSGIAFYSHDIGGFIGRPSAELYIRWAQFGLFSSHSRCHGSGDDNSREPSSFGEEALNIFKKYTQLRYRMLPYIVNQSQKSIKDGLPLTRGLVLVFPQDYGTTCIEDEYMLGDHLLIAPIILSNENRTKRTIYLPYIKQRWIDFHTNEVMPYGYSDIDAKLELLPMYVKSDAVIPYGENRMHTHNTLDTIKEIHVYPDFNGKWDYDIDGIEISMVIENAKVIELENNLKEDPRIIFK